MQDGEVVIVDEFTGPFDAGTSLVRRYCTRPSKLRKACSIQHENQTMASITFQNYFRMYEKLSGMTGTADTEAYEFQDIYGLETVVIPTHRKMIRNRRAGQGLPHGGGRNIRPSLRTSRNVTRRDSRFWSVRPRLKTPNCSQQLLTKEGIEHNVLNAKQHEREAQIVA